LKYALPEIPKKEMDVKFDSHKENLVREYWLVDPASETALIHVLKNNKFVALMNRTQLIKSPTFQNLSFPVKNIFDF
jgi:Uma2 family endonuclease